MNPETHAREEAAADRVREVLELLPREHFIEMSSPGLVLGRSIPPAKAVFEILRHADIQPHHRVLQIGTGAGYLAALASKLAAEVYTLEKNHAIAQSAQQRFNRLELVNIVLREGDGSAGAQDWAPFDRILVSTATVSDKQRLMQQLTRDGVLLALEQGEHDTHLLTRYSLTELGASVRKELALVDFSKESGMSLLDIGMVDQQTLARARQDALHRQQPVIKVLREQLDLEDATLYRRLASENGMTFASADDLLPNTQWHLMGRFSRSFLDSMHILPLREEDDCLDVATDDPDCDIEDILHMYPYERIRRILVTPGDFRRLWTTIELSLQGNSRLFQQEKEKKPEQDLKQAKKRFPPSFLFVCFHFQN